MPASATIEGGVDHDFPADLEAALMQLLDALATWRDITPLARNEWICWVTSPRRRKGARSGLLGVREPCTGEETPVLLARLPTSMTSEICLALPPSSAAGLKRSALTALCGHST